MSALSDAYVKPERYVRTTNGCIRGRRCQSIYGDLYYSFERVPYAEPPIGELRFKAPVPVRPWTTLLDCTQKAEKPLQYNFPINLIEGSEDCLYANVYVKQFGTKSLLPVMVYLYGGSFKKGDPTRNRIGPDYFMSRNVILVTIAYRVGALGFLSFDDPDLDCPGNAGLKDQLLGMKWVKSNAERFNGDPNNITLFGCSAGAASAHFLLICPLAKGLFHKAILQSGTALCPWAICNLKCLPLRLAKQLGYNGDINDADIFKFLKNVGGEKIVKAFLLTEEEQMRGHIFSFGPVVEPYISSHCMIPYRPEILIPKAWGNNIPMMIGATSFEGLFMKARIKNQPILIQGVERDKTLLLPNVIQENFSPEKQQRLATSIWDVHFLDEIARDEIISFCEYISYKFFWHPIHRTILMRQWYSCAPTYVYRFDFDSPFYNYYRIKCCGNEERGATHCDDLCYLFHSLDSWKLDRDTREFQNIRRMIAIWTAFAKNSNPNSKNVTGNKWMPVGKSESDPMCCLNISTNLRVMELPEMPKLRVWNDLYKESFDYDED